MTKLKVELKQQTPIIHFQAEQYGATLRATELKPKLDKFITKHFFNYEHSEFKDYLIGDRAQYKNFNGKTERNKLTPAYDYKVTIKSENSKPERISQKRLFFANMDKNNKEETKQLFTKENIELNFFSFNNCLIDIISKNIKPFLATTNFGLRQNKGFGSFYIKGEFRLVEDEIKKVKKKYLYKKYNLGRRGRGGKYNNILDDIWVIYSLMKSGVNINEFYKKGYLFKYFLDKNMGNDKRFIKENFFREKDRNEKNDMNKKFVRALLGLAEQYEFKDNKRQGKIFIESEEIERFKSPITFKVIKGRLFILPETIPPKIYGREFNFYPGNKPDNKKTIKTPAKFDLPDFLFSFADYFNNINVSKNSRNFFARMLKKAQRKRLKKVGETSG